MQIIRSNNVKAALLMMLAMALLASNDVIMKRGSENLGIGQLLFIRGSLAIAIFSFAIKVAGRRINLESAFSKWVVLRAFSECGATLCFIIALSLLPFATASTLLSTSPIFLTIAASLVLRERVAMVRWLAVLVGFIGVVLVANPGSADFSLAMLLPLAAAVLLCVRDLVTRKLDPSLNSLCITWTTLVVVTVAGLLLSFLDWRPVEITQVAWLSGSAVLISSAFFFLVSSVRLGELSFIAPFSFTGTLIAVVYGIVVWNELLGPTMILGIALIIVSGLYILSHPTNWSKSPINIQEATQ